MATYQTRNGNTYDFSFEKQSDGSIRSYISRMPSYGSRDTSLHTTHRLKADGRYYVCWTKPLYSEGEAKAVAAAWADRTDRYIRTGVGFDR